MVRAGLLMYFLVCCWKPPFSVEAGMHYSWDAKNVKGIFQFPEQHLKTAPVYEVTWPGAEKDRPEAPRSNPLPLSLPMFQHTPVPLAGVELFKPVAGKRPLPHSLVDLLLPHRYKPSSTHVPLSHRVARVEVSCGSSIISVRVNRKYLGFKAPPSMFRLGTCAVTFATAEYLYFHYYLYECGSISTTVKGKLLYSNTLIYSPEPQEEVLRAVPLSVPIHCQYNRFHYSYKVGYVPEVKDRVFLKSLKNRRTFNLTALNAQWETLDVGEEYVLGEATYFEVSAQHISKDQRVFVDSCHVTPSQDPDSMPRQDVISNYGCLLDSTRSGSPSQFYSRESNILRFSIDTFLFPNVATERLYLHCSANVGNKDPTVTSKSCTYNRTAESWEELNGCNSVCTCCMTKCEHSATKASIPFAAKSLITSDSWKVVQRARKSASSLATVVMNSDTNSTQDVRLEVGDGAIQEMETIGVEEPDMLKSGFMVKDGDRGEEVAVIREE